MKKLTSGRPIRQDELSSFLAAALSDVGRPDEHVLIVVPDNT